MPDFGSALWNKPPSGDTGEGSGGGSSDPVTRSLRFNDGDNSALYFDPTASHDSSTVYTFSCWAKLGEMDAESYEIFTAGHYTSGSNQDLIYFGHNTDSKLRVWLRSTVDSTNITYISTAVFRDPSAWYHLLLVRNGASLKVYVNNTEVISVTISSTQRYGVGNGYPMHIGSSVKPTSSGVSSYASFDGLLADVYFTDGYAKSPTDFIESNNYGGYIPKEYTGAFGTNGFHIDAQPANGSDLMVTSVARHDGDTTFVDVAAGHTITTNGDPEHSIAVGNPFTGDDRAIYFDGNNDTVAVTTGHSDFAFGTGDFTVEGWYYFKSIPSSTDAMLVDFRPTNSTDTDTFAFSTDTTNGVKVYSGGNFALGGSLSTNTWHHIALVRDSGTLYAYIDGTATGTTQTFGANLTANSTPRLGATADGGTSAVFTGYIFDVRVTKGTARYTANFTPPTSKLETEDSDTKLLIQPHKDDTDFHDETSNSHTLSVTDSPTRTASTPYDAAAKSTAIHLDGTGDRVMANHSSDFNFGTGAFTIEMWHKHISSVNGSSGSSNITGDIVISKGKWHTSTTGWLLKTVNYGTDVLNFDMYMGDGSFSNQVNLVANSSGVTTVHDGDWHHIAITRDGSGNMGLFVDGTRVDDESGTGYDFDATSYGLRMGAVYGYDNVESNYANCYLYDVRVTKGEAKYAPTSSSVTKPSAPFELNPVYIGGDQSGNKNHFSVSGISITHDVMLDVPTKNYATFNPLYSDNHSASEKDTLTEGNCEADYTTGSSGYYTPTTVGFNTGKFYFEVYAVSASSSGTMVGVVNESATGYVGSDSNGVGYHDSNGTIYNNGNTGTSYSTFTTGDIIGCAFDADTKKVWFAKNNSWNGSPTAGTGQAATLSGTLFAAVRAYSGTLHINAGADNTFAGNKTSGQDTSQGEFYYAPPTGFKSLNTSNLDDPAVTPAENFGVALYNGNSSSNAITGLGFEPSLLWTKSRSTSGTSHKVYDSVRGVTKKLETDNTTPEGTVSSDLTSFDSDGFTLGSGNGSNYTGRTYVGWNWKAHQSPTSSSTRTTYTVKVEDSSDDAWDAYGNYYDYSTYLPSVYMEIFENRNSSLVSLGKVAVRYYDSSGNYMSDTSEQTYTLECADLNAIAVKWHYDTSGDGQEYDYPNSYNDYLNEQKITILDGSTSEWTTNNYSNDDGSSYNYSPPTGWANGDTLKSATTSYNGSDTATLTSDSGASDPVEKYNAAAGFTIISYSGDGSTSGDTQELDHSLGVPLEFVIAKARTNNDSYDNGRWIVYHKDLTSGDYLMLNSNAAADTPYEGYDIISTSVSGSQHKVVVGNDCDSNATYCHYLNSGPDNGTGEDYILYGWAGVEGYSKFGKYTGNASADGPFIYTGFRPAFVLIKPSSTSGGWLLFDSARDSSNPMNNTLYPHNSNAESGSGEIIDFYSSGFKIRGNYTDINSSGDTKIYAAFAEQPFAAPSNAK